MPSFPPADPLAALSNPTVRTTDPHTGHVFDTTSPAWKAACAPLPSCAAVQWPGYATVCIPAAIDGREVVIQPWMGHCEQFLGRARFPGGFGGEVGVYVKHPGGKPLPDVSWLPLPVQLLLKAAHAFGDHHLWWPDPEVQPEIHFKIINPLTKAPVLQAHPEKNYWVNKWMEPNSFEQYKASVGDKVPFWSTAYKMVYTVAGVTREWEPHGGQL